MTDVTTDLPTIPAEVVAALETVVGDAAVSVERTVLREFTDAYWIPGDTTYAASAIVQPTTAEQVREIVRIANRHGIPVWPLSQGRNLGHGGPSPRVRGSIQIGFQRMNRILEINEELAYAVVEPGVTWFDLYNAVAEAGYDLLTPCPDLGWGSIIGNSMDGGHTYQHYGADYLMPTGFEVVLPDGDLVRTGFGGVPESSSWHLTKRALGPALESLFVQSNFGIVTRMGVWLKRKPPAYAPLTHVIGDDADHQQGIDVIREMLLGGDLEGVPALYSTLRAAHMLRDAPVPPGPRPFTGEELDEIGSRLGVGAWAARAAIWGDPDVVKLKLRRIRDAWSRVPSGVCLSPRVYTADELGQIELSAEKILAGIPTLQALQGAPPNIGHVDVSPSVPLRGASIRRAVTAIRELFVADRRDFGVGIMIPSARSAVVIAGIRYDSSDADAVVGAMQLARSIVRELGAMGYVDSRPHLEFMDTAADFYSFNDGARGRLLERVKDALDPNGILSPGRHGVWPAAYRSESRSDARRTRLEGEET